MEFNRLKGFYHVARLGSFTRAAKATFRTQSALSQQVKALEEELGCRLLERIGRKKLRITAAGERLLEFAGRLLDELDRVEEDINDLKGLKKGRLRIAAPFTTLYHLFPGIVKSYVDRFPQVELTLLDRGQHEVIKLVKEGEVDFGVALESLVPKELFALPWKKVETVVMVPADHPLAEDGETTPDRIARYPLILPPRGRRHTGRDRLERAFHELGVDYRVIMESSNVELSSLYVEKGLGISFATVVSDLLVLEGRNLKFVDLKGPFGPELLCVAMRPGKALTPLKRAFLDTIF